MFTPKKQQKSALTDGPCGVTALDGKWWDILHRHVKVGEKWSTFPELQTSEIKSRQTIMCIINLLFLLIQILNIN